MNPKKVYVTLSQFCEHDDSPRKILLDAGFQVEENKTGKRIKSEDMYTSLRDVDAVLAAVEPYDADLLSKLPRLKCISRCGAGSDAIDQEAAKKFGKAVCVTRDEIVEPVAQMTVGMIFCLTRNFALHQRDFLSGLWKKHSAYLLSELTIGIIGFGNIGRKVAEYLRPFGCRILVADPFVDPQTVPEGISYCSQENLLRESDLVTLHIARDPSEGYFFTKQQFQQMKRGSYFVNTARGYMVNEADLQVALDTGPLAGAALDVFENEPYKGPLSAYPNVLLTPHVATLTRASRVAMELKCAQNVVDFFSKLEMR